MAPVAHESIDGAKIVRVERDTAHEARVDRKQQDIDVDAQALLQREARRRDAIAGIERAGKAPQIVIQLRGLLGGRRGTHLVP